MDREKKRQSLYEKYGHLIGKSAYELPVKHKNKLNGGLRCFHRVFPRDEDGMKIMDKKVRCGNTAVKGSLFCRKHNGGNSSAMTHGKTAITAQKYRGAFSHKFEDLVDAFLNDPAMLDLKPELASLRTILNAYIEKHANAKPKSPKKFCKTTQNLMENEGLTDSEKAAAIIELAKEQQDILDGEVIDRINRLIGSIGKVVQNIQKSIDKESFMLTPDGLKVFLRAVIEIISKNISDKEVVSEIRKGLLEVSTMTGGDIAKYNEKNVTVESQVINEED